MLYLVNPDNLKLFDSIGNDFEDENQFTTFKRDRDVFYGNRERFFYDKMNNDWTIFMK